jgi:anti-sigma factor RsiW
VNNHLSEDQITEWVLGTRDECVRRHLESCDACSVEAEELRRAISSFRDSVHATAQSDESFWRNQQLALCERVSARDWYPLHWAWAVAMVMVLITAIFLTRRPNTPPNHPSEDADNALLQEVQGDLGRQVPRALAPAVLIAEERNEILTNKVIRQTETTLEKRRQMK